MRNGKIAIFLPRNMDKSAVLCYDGLHDLGIFSKEAETSHNALSILMCTHFYDTATLQELRKE